MTKQIVVVHITFVFVSESDGNGILKKGTNLPARKKEPANSVDWLHRNDQFLNFIQKVKLVFTSPELFKVQFFHGLYIVVPENHLKGFVSGCFIC